jgi:septal ring factor EnvC (AmiA/AmiB activator)
MAFAAATLAGSVLAQSAQDRLAASVRDAGQQLQNTRTDLQSTVGALTELRNQSGDLRPAYEKFSDSIEKTRNSAGLTANLYDTMSADSKTYFASWQSEIDGISNPDIKKASTKRLKAVQKEYDSVVKELKPIQPQFNPMMSDLDDFKKALGMDLTPAGLRGLSKTMDKTNRALANFQEPLVKTMTAFDKLSTDLTPAAPAAK